MARGGQRLRITRAEIGLSAHTVDNVTIPYARFTLSYRDVEEFLAERELDIS